MNLFYICGILKKNFQMTSHLLIGAIASGCGKTTFTIGLLRALKKRGLQVQPFKCGPDYIDTQYHTIAADRNSVNLDTWLASDDHIHCLYNKYGAEADVCVTEGVMGLFDGYRKAEGSSAQIAQLLDIPIVLLVNSKSTAYSVAPLIYGFMHFNPNLRIIGVVFNQVSSASHFLYLKDACKDVGVTCLGYLPQTEGLQIPSRHLGLTLSAESSMDEFAERASDLIEQYVDVGYLLSLCKSDNSVIMNSLNHRTVSNKLRIAVAKDEAFNFVYQENLSRLCEWGDLSYFSPLHEDILPEADLIYLPGGYPELFAYRLSRRKQMMTQIKDYAESGGKILAECGGMMYLTRSLTLKQGKTYVMAGVLPFDSTMKNARLHLGYRQLEYKGLHLKGHEFHYSELISSNALASVTQLYNVNGIKVDTPLYRYKNVLAGYTHLYWGEAELLKIWE
jgi:cobyrinic acid a,c-diamide synthase